MTQGRSSWRRFLAANAALAVVLAACGDAAAPPPESVTTAPPASTTTPSPPTTTTTTTTTTAAAATTTVAPTTTVEVEVTFQERYPPDRALDVYTPAGAVAAPAVVMLHGCCGGKGEMADLAAAVAARGFVVFNASWSNGSLADTGEEIACLSSFIADRGGEFGADPAGLTVVGYSGGAEAATLWAMSADLLQPGGCELPPLAVRAYVGIAGPYRTPEDLYEGEDPGSAAGDLAPGLTRDELADVFSPWRRLDAEPPPLTLVHGEDDSTVDPARAVDFAAAAEAAGVPVELVLVPGGHGTILLEEAPAFPMVVDAVVAAAGAG